MTCLFCNIALGKTPAELIHEDAETAAFLDIHPRAPGHTVVILKTHTETLNQVSGDMLEPLFSTVKTVTEKLEKSIKPDGFTIGWNHGASAGQAIPHLHIHIIPRFQHDGGGSIHSVVSNPSKTSIHELRNTIKQA